MDKKKTAKPILKWAGGKTQLLTQLTEKIPSKFSRYIEPFIGGGALFFSMEPPNALIGDSNPELINVYNSISKNVNRVIEHLYEFENTESCFYEMRKLNFLDLEEEFAAARTIFLNKTCYNGLYRVNKSGGFNVPFGSYKNPSICQADALKRASEVLKNVKIVCDDYINILRKHAQPGDFIFLDPPYMPVSQYSDFKRYTKEQFHEDNHRELAEEVKRLEKMGCYVLLTNSNHPLVFELYNEYEIQLVETKRNISSKTNSRKGHDVIVNAIPNRSDQSVGYNASIPTPKLEPSFCKSSKGEKVTCQSH